MLATVCDVFLGISLFLGKANQKQYDRTDHNRQVQLENFISVIAAKGHKDNGDPDKKNSKEYRDVFHLYNYTIFNPLLLDFRLIYLEGRKAVLAKQPPQPKKACNVLDSQRRCGDKTLLDVLLRVDAAAV